LTSKWLRARIVRFFYVLLVPEFRIVSLPPASLAPHRDKWKRDIAPLHADLLAAGVFLQRLLCTEVLFVCGDPVLGYFTLGRGQVNLPAANQVVKAVF
jgi:hypothetical protein